MIAAAAVIAAGVAATIIDVRTRRVPNVLTMGTASAGLLLAMAGLGAVGIGQALGGLTLGLALLMPAHMRTRIEDPRSVFLGPADVFDAFLRAALMGGAMALGVALWRGRLRETLYGTAMLVTTRNRAAVALVEHPAANNRFPYAPAIACGAALVVLGW